jgi:hypothetical protein
MATDLQSDNKNQTEGVYIATQVTSKGKIKQRAILDGLQAWRMFEEIENQNQERNTTDALIWNKYNEGQPFDPVALRNSGQGNRYNFPTGFMTAIVEKVVPVPCKIIDQARFLTSASLCDYDYNTKMADPAKGRKTEVLREKVTRYIRRWPDWKTFYQGLSQELVLIGRAFALRIDPFTPWPKLFKTDQAFLPNGTGEHARNIQVIVAKQDYLVHELVNFINAKENASDAGWKIEACVQAINEALPKQLNEDASISQNMRSYEDAIREGNLGSSYSGATIIPVSHVWAVEPSDTPGKENTVTHYVIHRRMNHEVLFMKEDRYKRIEDLAALFTIEPGNGKFYGSRGLGRKLINKHLAIERMRNRLYDQLEMSGLVILQTDAASAPTVQFKVRHPFILTTTDAKMQEQVVEANVKSFMDADAMMRDWTQHAVGQYLPSSVVNDQGDREKTAKEVSIDAHREAEAQVAFLSRFWGQFADLISMMQRGLLDPDTNDKQAKELQAELEEAGVTREEMEEFANAPAAEVVQDLTQIQAQMIAMVSAKYVGNPNINQRELMIRDISAMTSPSIAASLILPEQGMATNIIESARQQMMETELIMSPTNDQGMPVSPRDDHENHLKVLIPDLAKAISQLGQMGGHPAVLGKLALGITHAEGHLKWWTQNKGDPKLIKQYHQPILEMEKTLKKATIASAQQMTQIQDQQGQDQQAAQQQAAMPAEEMIKIYKDAPEKVRRQIEQKLGFVPPTEEEMAQEHAREATLKHPDLPERVAAATANVAANQGAPMPMPPQVTPPGAIVPAAPTAPQDVNQPIPGPQGTPI